jgi:hypothetical protein
MKDNKHTNDTSDKWVIGLSRYLRWGLGIGFFIFGIKTFSEGGWAALLIGTVLIVTGFLRPKRCLNENVLHTPSQDQN